MQEQDFSKYQIVDNIRTEIHKKVVGQEKIVDGLIRAILVNGHVLIEGVPGLAKTVLVKSMAEVLGCQFNRVQFTVDLLPSDIIGINSFDKDAGGYKIVKGPIFTNLLLADEINRASPKVQSALLEAMAELQVTIGNQTITLPSPFFVFATQNPLESLGTYPLPQAQLDRFLFKLIMKYPTPEDEMMIIDANKEGNTSSGSFSPDLVLNDHQIAAIQQQVNQTYISEEIKRYIVHIVNATRRPKNYHIPNADFLEVGCGPRATLAIVSAAKAEAFMNGRDYVTPHDVKEVSLDVLRHRLEINYLGQSKNYDTDKLILEILSHVPMDAM